MNKPVSEQWGVAGTLGIDVRVPRSGTKDNCCAVVLTCIIAAQTSVILTPDRHF
jgi:hypothetical protein